MELIKWVILMVLVLPVPFLLGLIPVKYMNSLQRTPAMTYVCGWFVSFFVFELIAVPFILLEQSFTSLVVTYTILIVVLLLGSVLQGRQVLQEQWNNLKNRPKQPVCEQIGWIVVFLIVAAQMAYAVLYEYYDGDDAYYIATAVLADGFDTMYLRDSYTGYIYDLDARHAFSPTPIYQAWLSRLSGIAPAAVAHSVLAPVWLMFMYCIYAQISNRLFWNKKSYRPVFMILMAVWFMFGNISLYTAETFAMTRTWQGKGMMAGMVLPALLLCLMYLAQEQCSKGIWILFVCVIVSAVFATSISFMIVPTVVGTAAAMIGIRNRSIKHPLKMFACCIPCILLAVCYLSVR